LKKINVALLIFAALVFFAGSVRGQQPVLTATSERSSIFATYPALKHQASEYGEAFVGKDFERLVDLTWPAYVERFGRQALLTDVAQGARELEALGGLLVSWAPREATQLIEDSGSLYAVVPTAMRIKAGEQTSELAVCLIAISTDQGEHWKFISSSCVRLKDAFPEVAERLILCPEKQSVTKTEPVLAPPH
jgi:hypothetical protein